MIRLAWFVLGSMLFSQSMLAADLITMQGRVINKTDHSGILGATVSLTGGEGDPVTSDSDGRFSIRLKPRAPMGSQIQLMASKPGFTSVLVTVNVANILDRDIELAPIRLANKAKTQNLAQKPTILVKYQPNSYLEVLFKNTLKIVLTAGGLEGSADVLVRLTDEHGVNRELRNELAIRRGAGGDFDTRLQEGLARLNGTLGGHGTAFMIPTMSAFPGQVVCTTYAPTFKSGSILESERLGQAYDTCFSLGTMTSTLSVALPGYGGTEDQFPVAISAPVVIDHLLKGLERAGTLKELTIAVAQDAFPTYLQILTARLRINVNRTR